jgi:hypothetical protein
VGPSCVAGVLGQPGCGLGDPGCFEGGGQVG